MENNKIIIDLNDMIKYFAFGTLNNTIESKNGIITLYELNSRIVNMNLVRKSILNKFIFDTFTTFKKYDLKNNIKISFNPNKILSGPYLDLKLLINSLEYNLLISKYRIEKYDNYDFKIDEKISQIFKYIEGLFRLLDNIETKNLLLNEFYDVVDISFLDYIEKFNISGNGIKLSLYDSNLESLNLEEKIKGLEYFYNNYSLLLEHILLFDDKILDRYKTDINKSKALKIYKKK